MKTTKQTKKPTPQISPRHCKECGQLIGSEHCKCAEVFMFGAELASMDAIALNRAYVQAWDCNEGDKMRMIRAERERRGWAI